MQQGERGLLVSPALLQRITTVLMIYKSLYTENCGASSDTFSLLQTSFRPS